MFLAHSFRLRDPWQCESLEDGALRWSRGFHRPTGLEADDALWLVIAGLPADAQVTLNGQLLVPPTGQPAGQFDVTALLADSNRVEITLPSTPAACGLASPPFPYDARLGVMAQS